MISRIRTLFILTLLLCAYSAPGQTFQWAKDIKSEGFDEGYDLATDPEGNTYVAGMIEYDTDFGNGIILSSAGIHDIFLAKYNPNGKLVWAKRAGGKGGDKIQSIVLDGSGHIYVAGEFEDTCYWDGIMKATPGMGINNMFVAKYDTSGPVIWVRNIAGSGPLHTRGYGVTCDAVGNVYACGGTKGDTYYDNTFLFTSAGDYDGTVVKFDPNGNFRWARRMGGADSDKAYGIVSDKQGSIYVTGYFVGSADFSGSTNLTGRGHTDIFLAKYDTSGILQWAKQAGDTGFDRGWDVDINTNGQILITGEFQTGRFGSNMAYSRGNEDMFLASYNSNGTNLWVVSGGSVEDDIGRGVTHDTSGAIYVIGDYANTGFFPPATVTSNGYSDIFLACYDSDGTNLKWVRSTGGLENDRGRGVGTDLAGNVSVCGEFVDSIRFDASNLIGDTLLDIFVARLNTGHTCSTQIAVSAQNICSGSCNGIVVANASGQGPFVYSWSTSPAQSGATASGLCHGTYSVITTDALGCSATASVTLTDPPLLQATTTFTNATCAGNCNGVAIASATGQAPFTFNWLTSPSQSGDTATGLCQGSYTVFVSDAAGCTSTALVTLMDPPPLIPSATFTNSRCTGSCDGLAIATATGQGPFSYNWSSSPLQSGDTAIGLCQGTYTVIVSDAAGCSSSAQVSLVDPPLLQPATSFTNATCAGSCDGVATASATGQGPFTFDWLISPPISGTIASGLCQGTFSVLATDVAGCTATAQVTLTDPPVLQSSTTFTNSSCAGSCDGEAQVSATGQAPFTFSWSTSPPQSGTVASGLCQGTYTVIASDVAGCTVSASIALTDPTPLHLTTTITNATCIGCTDGAIDLLVSGGTTGYHYAWSTGDTSEDEQNLGAGVYQVCVIDLHNCTVCDTLTVLDPGSGIAVQNADQGISVFPNPFSSFTTIHLNNPTGELTRVILFSATGQVVYQSEFSGIEFQIQAHNLANGVYFLRIQNKFYEGMRPFPLILEK